MKRHRGLRLSMVCCACVASGLRVPGPATRATPVRDVQTGPYAGLVGGVAGSAGLPLAFEPTWGQAGTPVRFLARGRGYTVLLSAIGIMLVRDAAGNGSVPEPLGPVAARPAVRTGAATVPRAHGTILQLVLLGASPRARMSGCDPLPGRVNYLMGNNPRHWHTDIPTYACVVYRGVYPGIDQVVSSRDGCVAYRFVVHPGANAARIRIQVQGTPSLPASGAARVPLDAGSVLALARPPMHRAGPGRALPLRAVSLPTGEQGLVNSALTGIDQQHGPSAASLLSYATYLGEPDTPVDGPLAVDPAGEVALLSEYGMPGEPTASLGSRDGIVHVIKLNAAGTAVLYSTYLGGSGTDTPAGITMDRAGNTYITGTTSSNDFPTTHGTPVPARRGHDPVGFVAVLNAAGTALRYSTYLDASGPSAGVAIAVDDKANAYVAAQVDTPEGDHYGRVLKLATAGVDLARAGDGRGYALQLPAPLDAIAIDGTGHAYVSGIATGGDTFRALFGQAPGKAVPGLVLGPAGDARFVAKLNPTGTVLEYASSLGTLSGTVRALGVDRAGSTYLSGTTTTTGFPTTPGALSTCHAHADANVGASLFVAKLAASGTTLSYVTCLPGAAQEFAGMAVDALGHAYIAGTAYAGDAATTANARQPKPAGGTSDIFLTKLNLRGTALAYGSYLSRRGDNAAKYLAVDSRGNAYLDGYTGYYNLPTTDGAAQPNFEGSYHEGFVMRVVLPEPPLQALAPVPPPSPSPGVQYVPATHHTIQGPLLAYWRGFGGVAMFGLPLSEAFDEDGRTVQYFERARMILTGTAISLTPLGSLFTAGHRFDPAPPELPPDARIFPTTGHTLSGPFLRFWQQHQGQTVLGSPISEPIHLQAGDHTTHTHLVQYLQNARLEYHPELAGTGREISLGLLGTEYLQRRGLL